jgi:phage terminase small subunit
VSKAAAKSSPLNAKQQRFVEEYLLDLNATQAAIRAGYSAKTAAEQASDLLRNPKVAVAVEAGKAKRSQKVGVTAEYVLENLQEVTERCMQRAPVLGSFGQQVTDEEGRAVWKFDAKGAIGALGLLGKHLGMFTDKVEHSGGIDLQVSVTVAEA